jgi:hypothetical protein
MIVFNELGIDSWVDCFKSQISISGSYTRARDGKRERALNSISSQATKSSNSIASHQLSPICMFFFISFKFAFRC